MKKYVVRFILILLGILALLSSVTIITHSSMYNNSINETIEETTQAPVIYLEFQYVEQNTSNNCLKQIEQCQSYIEYLLQQVNVETELLRVQTILTQYTTDYELLLLLEEEQRIWGEKMSEYPEATQIWRIMKEEFGWNDIVCAGIMGNMMAEVAGGTLYALDNWSVNGSSGYGLIQWIGQRRADIKAIYGDHPSLEQQLYFMKDELFGTNGVRKQVSDAQLNAIMNATSPEEAAYKFAVYFERCADWARNCRKGYARIAYDYFVD